MEVLTYCVMSNHFHAFDQVFVHEPPRPAPDSLQNVCEDRPQAAARAARDRQSIKERVDPLLDVGEW